MDEQESAEGIVGFSTEPKARTFNIEGKPEFRWDWRCRSAVLRDTRPLWRVGDGISESK